MRRMWSPIAALTTTCARALPTKRLLLDSRCFPETRALVPPYDGVSQLARSFRHDLSSCTPGPRLTPGSAILELAVGSSRTRLWVREAQALGFVFGGPSGGLPDGLPRDPQATSSSRDPAPAAPTFAQVRALDAHLGANARMALARDLGHCWAPLDRPPPGAHQTWLSTPSQRCGCLERCAWPLLAHEASRCQFTAAACRARDATQRHNMAIFQRARPRPGGDAAAVPGMARATFHDGMCTTRGRHAVAALCSAARANLRPLRTSGRLSRHASKARTQQQRLRGPTWGVGVGSTPGLGSARSNSMRPSASGGAPATMAASPHIGFDQTRTSSAIVGILAPTPHAHIARRCTTLGDGPSASVLLRVVVAAAHVGFSIVVLLSTPHSAPGPSCWRGARGPHETALTAGARARCFRMVSSSRGTVAVCCMTIRSA